MKKLYLIDGSGFIFRAYHVPTQIDMMSRDGVPVKAVYIFTNMLLKLLEAHTADSIAVIFDAGRQTFRNRLYSEYKAHRPPPPEDLVPQFPLVREATEAMNIPAIELEDYEADDLIATYTREAREQGMEVVIVSSDKDLMQLIGEGVSMHDAMKNKPIGVEQVREKFGVGPDHVRDVLALIGDTSDNIPGVPGIGPKTAAELVIQFGSLHGILDGAATITQRARREGIIANMDKARLSYELIGLCDTVPLPQPLAALAAREPDHSKLLEFTRRMGFKTLSARLEEKHGIAPAPLTVSENTNAPIAIHYELVRDEAVLERWCDLVRKTGMVSLHLHTTSPNAEDTEIIGIALCVAPGHACYIPLNHIAPRVIHVPQTSLFEKAGEENRLMRIDDQLHPDAVLRQLSSFLSDRGILKICFNGKQAILALTRARVELAPLDDVMLMSYALDAGRGTHTLESLAAKYLGIALPTLDSMTGSGKARLAVAQLPPEKLLMHAAEETDVILRLWRELKPALVKSQVVSVYETIERPLVHVVAAMEMRGIKVDPAQLSVLSADFAGRMAELEKDVYALAGEEFNLGSPKQLGEILFDKLKLSGGKKNAKTGSYGTGADILEEMAENGEILPARILDWRQLSKLKNTYTDALAQEIKHTSGRVHTSFAMAATTTGRLSSNSPNLQNIPIRSEEGRKIRHAFIADEGHKLISADYSQIELRLLADMADIAPLKDAFKNGDDIHAITASQMFGVPVTGVNSDLRRKAKTINFGIIYGISAHGLAVRLGISRGEAGSYIETYFRQYPGIQAYMERTKLFARQHGFVTTLFGRRCHVSGINDKNPSMRSFSERAAINAPLQGTAADIIKRAMIKVEAIFRGSPCRMLLQVHDELIVEAPDALAADTAAKLKSVMENAAHLSVPLTVDTSVGVSWGKS